MPIPPSKPVKLTICVVILAAAVLAGCGGGSMASSPSGTTSTPTPASITVQAATSAPVMLGQTEQFTALVQNASNTTVTWEVNSVAGGNATVGTISSSGLYTAPTTIPSPNQIQITAVSTANSAISGSANITLSSNISVSVSPQNPSVIAGTQQQFLAVVQNAINVAVTWEVNGVQGGTSTTGTIDTTGLYSAPASVPTGSITIAAVSVADPSKSGSTGAAIKPPIIVTVSPVTSNVLVGGTLQFNATVRNTSNTSVTWQVVQTGNPVGSISSSGLYTAPATVTGPTIITIMAYSMVSPTQSGSAMIIVNDPGPNASELNGRYVFVQSTDCPGSGGLPASTEEAGSVVADGGGNFTSGVTEAINFTLDDPVQNVVGAYSVDANHNGQGVFVSVTAGTAAAARICGFQFSLGGFNAGVAGRAQLSGSGAMFLQDSTPLSNAAITGDYAFSTEALSNTLLMGGVFRADGAGNLSNGILDANNSLSTPPLELNGAPFTGSYQVDASTGRGTATLNIPTVGAINVVFYAISPTKLLWIGEANEELFLGSALQQSGGPFSVASLNATTVFAMRDVVRPQSVGLMTADGSGNITGTVDGTTVPNQAIQTDQSFSGTYTVSANGRGTLDVFGQHFLIYVVSPNSALIFEAPNDLAAQVGLLQQQSVGPFSNASINGAFIGGGTSSPVVETGGGLSRFNLSGTFSSDGAGNISGTQPGAFSFTATYSVSSNGRGTANWSTTSGGGTTGTWTFYMIAPNQFAGYSDPAVFFFGP